MRTGYSAFDHEYTYDHNGNRLTQTQNRALTQSFTYGAHDKLTGGIGETESYDPNGNVTAQTVNGQTTRFTWDDEDRLASTTLPDGHTDGNTYTGLGMRLSKTDGGAGYRSIIKTFLERAGMAAETIEGALDGLTLDIPIYGYYDPTLIHQKHQGGIDVMPNV